MSARILANNQLVTLFRVFTYLFRLSTLRALSVHHQEIELY